MAGISAVTAERDLAIYLTSYPDEMAFGHDEPAAILDRYHTTDVELYSDGILFDREKLIAHAHPTRKNVVSCQVEVHEAMVSGDRVAARYTLDAAMRKGRAVVMEIYMFGQLAPDGRIRRITQITRTLPENN